MGEILGQGKPKKEEKGKILLLVKKNWNWEFQCNSDIFFILLCFPLSTGFISPMQNGFST